jgi:hypothetical protein
MRSARAARTDHLHAQRLAGAEHADAGIAARDPCLVGVVLHGHAVDFDPPERRRVLGLEGLGELGDALAHNTVELVVGVGATAMVDDRVAQHAVEPTHGVSRTVSNFSTLRANVPGRTTQRATLAVMLVITLLLGACATSEPDHGRRQTPQRLVTGEATLIPFADWSRQRPDVEVQTSCYGAVVRKEPS